MDTIFLIHTPNLILKIFEKKNSVLFWLKVSITSSYIHILNLKWSHKAKLWLVYWISLRGASYLHHPNIKNYHHLNH